MPSVKSSSQRVERSPSSLRFAVTRRTINWAIRSICELDRVHAAQLWLTIPSLDLVLSEDEDQNHIVAQCRLPFKFNVLSKLPKSATRRKRKRVEFEEAEGAAPEPRSVRPRLDDTNVPVQRNPPSSEEIHHPAPATNYQDFPHGVQSREHGSFNPLPLVIPTRPRRSADANPEAIAPPTTDSEATPTLTELNPDAGSIRGGARIWLKGINFPSRFPLFARFGTTVVPTVRLNHLTLEPNLITFLRRSPPATCLPVICPPQPCQAWLALRYRRIRSRTRRSMGRVSRSLST